MLSAAYKIFCNILSLLLSPYVENIIGYHQYLLDIIRLLLITYSAFLKYWRRGGMVWNNVLFLYYKKACDLVSHM
jgi:hypothetical protein